MNTTPDPITIRRADLTDHSDLQAVALAIDTYASDPFGNAQRLPPEVVAALPGRLRDAPGAVVFLVEDGGEPVGVATCFMGLSTFAALPRLNIHDFSINISHRRRGLGRRLMQVVCDFAEAEGCCKVTLEVRHDNAAAKPLYAAAGFTPGDEPHEFWTRACGN